MRLVVVALLVAGALVAVHVALGGASPGLGELADPCRRAPPPAERNQTERAALSVLDGAACELRTSREALLLALLSDKPVEGVGGERLSGALRTGIGRARANGTLQGPTAVVVTAALELGGADALVSLLLGR